MQSLISHAQCHAQSMRNGAFSTGYFTAFLGVSVRIIAGRAPAFSQVDALVITVTSFWCRLRGFESLCPSQKNSSSEYLFALGCFLFPIYAQWRCAKYAQWGSNSNITLLRPRPAPAHPSQPFQKRLWMPCPYCSHAGGYRPWCFGRAARCP